jgi:hypothetical protein
MKGSRPLPALAGGASKGAGAMEDGFRGSGDDPALLAQPSFIGPGPATLGQHSSVIRVVGFCPARKDPARAESRS